MEKVVVNTPLCVGCGTCWNIEPETFKSNEEGLSEVVKDEITTDNKENIVEAVDACPTSAISIEE